MKNFKYFNLSIFLVIFFSIFVFSFEANALSGTCSTGILYGQKCSDYGPTYSWCKLVDGADGCKVEASDPYSGQPGVTDTDISCQTNTWSVTSCNTTLYTKCGNSCVLNSSVTPAANCQAGQTNICDGKCNTNGCNSGYTNCSGVCISTGTAPANCANYTTCGGCTQCNAGYTISNGTCYSLAGYWALNGTSISNTNGSNLGFVGFGTTTPNSLLHLFKDSGNNAELDIQSVTGLNNHWGLYSNRTDNSLRIWGGGDWLTILRNGSIGIGTTAPSGKLTLENGEFHHNLNNVRMLRTLVNYDGSSFFGELEQYYGGVLKTKISPKNNSYFNTQGGYVGIGLTNPSARLDVFGEIKGTSLTIGTANRTAWPVDAPIFRNPVYGANGDLPFRTGSLTPVSMRTVYGPISYAQPGCPAGTSKWYKIYAEVVDNMQSAGNIVYKMDFESGSDVLDFYPPGAGAEDTSDIDMGRTWGGSPSYRTALSGLFQTTNTAHIMSQMWLGNSPSCGGACYGEIRRVELWAYCI